MESISTSPARETAGNRRKTGHTDRGHRCGETHHLARYSDALVEAVRAAHERGVGYRRIAATYAVQREWVARVVRHTARACAVAQWRRR